MAIRKREWSASGKGNGMEVKEMRRKHARQVLVKHRGGDLPVHTITLGDFVVRHRDYLGLHLLWIQDQAFWLW